MIFTEKQIQDYFLSIDKHLKDKKNRYKSADIRTIMTHQIGAGVYYIFDKGKLCYVGESGSLHGRMRDFHRTLNHTFRRSLGKKIYEKHKQFKPPSSKIKFHPEIEAQLDSYIKNYVEISFCAIPIGRKEFEDWVQIHYPKIQFLNKRGKRREY